MQSAEPAVPERGKGSAATDAEPPSRFARWLAPAAFLLFLVAGLFAFDDYGVGWDDGTSRAATGLVNWNFVTRGAERPLLEGNEKYHGPAYELFLVAAEKVLGLQDTRAVFLMRHLALFLTFALAVLAFHQLARRALDPPWLAFAASAALVLSPRIFAEAFVNSKDLVFLSFSVFATWTLFRALERPTWLSWSVHALATGILIDIRILGILHAAVTAGCLLVLAARDGRPKLAANVAKAALYFALTDGFVILFWPVLWLGPWEHFRAALAEMSQYHWEGYVLYLGERTRSTDLPWHYLPYWILLTTPLLYSALFLAGVLALAKAAARSLREPQSLLRELDLRWLAILAYAFGPVLTVIALGSVVYDTWRHVFCVYPFLVLIAARGAQALVELARARGRSPRLGVALFALYGATIAVNIAVRHPHQNVWFNQVARALHSPLEQTFELDYWGFSYRQGLEWILAQEPAPARIRIAAANPACRNNFWILPARERERLEWVEDRASADYWLTNFRNPGEAVLELPPPEERVHAIELRGVPILAVYRRMP